MESSQKKIDKPLYWPERILETNKEYRKIALKPTFSNLLRVSGREEEEIAIKLFISYIPQ